MAFLTACDATTKYVRELPPEDLLADCPEPVTLIKTNGDLAKAIPAWRNALQLCNNDKQALRDWAKD